MSDLTLDDIIRFRRAAAAIERMNAREHFAELVAPRRFEVSTLGMNPLNQGLSTDLFLPNNNPTSLGLVIPPVLPGVTDPAAQPRYLFFLAGLTLSAGDRVKIRGIRQGLTIGARNLALPPASTYLEEFLVTSPFWHFSDGNVSWHLVREPGEKRVSTRPNTDAASWAFYESTSPSMLYQSFTNSNVNAHGQPAYYNLGLTAYAPPEFGSTWQPIAGMGNMKDMRSPWNAPTNAIAMDEIVEGSCRVSLYASVLQTNPTTRAKPNLQNLPPSAFYPGSITPESAFNYTFSGAGYSVDYARVFGAILFEHVQGVVSR